MIADFENLKKELAEFPEIGDLIPGTGGVRKIRVKSSHGGKSGGFRVCYLDTPKHNEILLILIYPKNESENLSSENKNALKVFTKKLKEKK